MLDITFIAPRGICLALGSHICSNIELKSCFLEHFDSLDEKKAIGNCISIYCKHMVWSTCDLNVA